jgi:hypothetical protein
LGFLFAHKRHPFNRRSSGGWCCIDLLNSPDFTDMWPPAFLIEELGDNAPTEDRLRKASTRRGVGY